MNAKGRVHKYGDNVDTDIISIIKTEFSFSPFNRHIRPASIITKVLSERTKYEFPLLPLANEQNSKAIIIS